MTTTGPLNESGGENILQESVSAMVRKNYRAADVFKKWGINYCCGGNLPLEQVCALQGLSLPTIQAELDEALRKQNLAPEVDTAKWSLPFLMDYIENVHHEYVRNAGSLLEQQLTAFVSGHLKKYPRLADVEGAYKILLEQTMAHIRTEQEDLFPYLRQLCQAQAGKDAFGSLFVRTLGRRVEQIRPDYTRLSSLAQTLRTVSDEYGFGADACTNYQMLFHKLRAFDEDLMQHIHLENNVLYPRMVEIEKELRAQ